MFLSNVCPLYCHSEAHQIFKKIYYSWSILFQKLSACQKDLKLSDLGVNYEKHYTKLYILYKNIHIQYIQEFSHAMV